MEEFTDYCKKHSLKVTPQREAIYTLLMNDESHPTADSIYKKVRTKCPNISLDTVNRTLITFAELGVVDTVVCSGQGRKYDSNTKPHHHLKCVKCAGIIDFYDKGYDRIAIPEDIAKKFVVYSKKVVLTGVCKSCKKKGGRKL